MPTLTYDKKDLIKLIGKDITEKEIEEAINMIKLNVEKIEKNEITVELTPDRADLFGIEGLARAIRYFLGIETGLVKYHVEEAKTEVMVGEVKSRPYIACAIVKNVKLSDELIRSLMNIQEALHETIGRNRKRVAIGIHDLEKIEPPISYKTASPEAKFLPLGEKKEMSLKEVLTNTQKGIEFAHVLSGEFPVYVDSKGIFSFPPILNSERTRIKEGTKSMFVEVTGTEKKSTLQTLNILVTNLIDRGCRVEAVKVKYGKKAEKTPVLEEENMEIDTDFVNKLIGLNLSKKEICMLLERMGYGTIEKKGKKINVIIPCYRNDILHSVDIVEDVAIAYGYNNLIPEMPNLATVGLDLPLENFCEKIRNLMVGFGFIEVLRPTLTNFFDQFDKMRLKGEAIEIENPVSEEYNCLRVWIIPSLLKVLSLNKHVEYPQNIFEIGDVVVMDENEEVLTKTIRKVGCTICHSKSSFSEVKGVVESLIKSLGLNFNIEEFSHPSFIDGRCCLVKINGKEVGMFGEIHPEVIENWKIEMPVSCFEIDLEALLNFIR
ncbi:MAG: phenylalanine--tRNA ligase subunit beta [Candidatus Aenigmatarchaeota archaeon]